MIEQHHIEALRALRSLSPRQRLAAVYEQEKADQHAEEQAKPTPTLNLQPEEWAALRAHLLDGGGVSDAHHVLRILFRALFDDDQATFWPELFHLLKAAAKHLGIVTPQPGGGVTFSGVGPTIATPPPQIITKKV